MGGDIEQPLLDGNAASPKKHQWGGYLDYVRQELREPTARNYVILAIFFGLVTGLVAFVYNTFFELCLQLVWGHDSADDVLSGDEGWLTNHMHTLPSLRTTVGEPLLKRLAEKLGTSLDRVAFLFILVISPLFGTLAGLVQHFMGFPGDLPDTVKNIHERGLIPIKQAPSMFLCSAFSITAGGSLGPEAPLLALCAATVSWISLKVFRHTGHMLRNCTLMGMAAGLAAFFGVGLGGSLFAFEVLHRTGIQFYEVVTYAVGTGMLCLVVFRGLSGFTFGQIWPFEEGLGAVDARHIIVGIVIGIISALFTLLFIHMHKFVNKTLAFFRLQEHKTPVLSGAVGGLLIGIIGILLPPTMFWAEYEMKTLADNELPLWHIWPKGGVWGTEKFLDGNYTILAWCLIAFFKLLAISITVLSGFRGGFIFPLFFAGASLGHGLANIQGIPFFSDLPPVMTAMAMSAGLNTAITRTPFATTLILTTLSGHPEVAGPAITSALTSFFLTMSWPFVKPQRDRQDIRLLALHFGEETGENGEMDRSNDHQHETILN